MFVAEKEMFSLKYNMYERKRERERERERERWALG
jgi:hypothetical protein